MQTLFCSFPIKEAVQQKNAFLSKRQNICLKELFKNKGQTFFNLADIGFAPPPPPPLSGHESFLDGFSKGICTKHKKKLFGDSKDFLNKSINNSQIH